MNAGWCQNDEANVHVDGIIDQHTLGHLYLRSKIGDIYTPRVRRPHTPSRAAAVGCALGGRAARVLRTDQLGTVRGGEVADFS